MGRDALLIGVGVVASLTGYFVLSYLEETSSYLLPLILVVMVTVFSACGWADAQAPRRLERGDSAHVHYTQSGSVEVAGT